MGCILSTKTISTFNPKLLAVDLGSEVSIIKTDERKKSSIQTLSIHQIEHISKNDHKIFINFLFSKFGALKELSLDDELDDGNPVQIRKIDLNKKSFSKKSNHVNCSQIKNSNKYLNFEKIKKPIRPKRKHSFCENVIKRNLYKINDLKEKCNSDRISTVVLHNGSCKNSKKSKFCHSHEKHDKSSINKDYINNNTLSSIKSKNSDCDKKLNTKSGEQKNLKDSLDSIRSLLKEMGN